MLGSIGYAMKQALKQVFRNRTMSVASTFSITAMLLILGLFFILLVNVNMVTESAKSQFDTIQVYLLDNTTYEQAEAMMQKASDMPEVDNVSYLSEQDAMQQLKEKWGEKSYLLDGLKENPLPNSLIIKVTKIENADSVVQKLKGFQGIEDVKYYKSAVEKLMKVTKFIQLGAMIVIAFLVIVSVVVVSNTVKLTVLAREREISIMKYVGATNWFIRGPFLVEGILIGIISALISGGLISLVYFKVDELISQDILVILSTTMVPENFLIINLFYIFIALGVSIGACGSIISMRRFLDT